MKHCSVDLSAITPDCDPGSSTYQAKPSFLFAKVNVFIGQFRQTVKVRTDSTQMCVLGGGLLDVPDVAEPFSSIHGFMMGVLYLIRGHGGIGT